MNKLNKIFLGLVLTVLIITSCTPPGTAADPDPNLAVSIQNITPGDSSIIVTLQAVLGIKVRVFAHTKQDYSDPGVKKEVAADGTSQEITIPGLTNNIPYYIRVQSENDKGSTQWIEPEDKAPHTPTVPAPDAAITQIQHNDGKITLTVSASAGITVTAFAHTQEDFSDQSVSSTEALSAGSPLVLSIEGLTPGSPYFIRVQGKNSEGDTAFVEAEENPHIPVPAFTITPGIGELIVTFQAPAGVTFRARISPSSDFSSPVEREVTATGNEQTLSLDSLILATPYYLQVQTEQNGQTSRWITADDNPHIPGTAAITAAGTVIKDGALGVTASTTAGLTLQVSASTASDFSGTSVDQEAPATGSPQEIILTGLTNGVPYYLQVMAKKNGIQVSEKMEVPQNPHIPQSHSINITKVTPGAGTLLVTAASYFPGINIEIEASENADFASITSSAEAQDIGAPQVIAVEGLTPGTPYYLRSRGESPGDIGAWTPVPGIPYTPTSSQIPDVIPRSNKITVIIAAPLGESVTLELSEASDFGVLVQTQKETGGGGQDKEVVFSVSNDKAYYVRLKEDNTAVIFTYSTPLIPVQEGTQYIHRLSELAKIGIDTENYPEDWTYELKMNLNFADGDNNGISDDPFDTDDDGTNGNWTPLTSALNEEFSGTFNGGEFTIDGMNIVRDRLNNAENSNLGLFGRIKGGTIQDLGLLNIDIAGGAQYIGGITGTASAVKISNSFTTGGIVSSNSNIIGGLAGKLSESSIITNSYSASRITGNIFVGGLVGVVSENSIVENAYATGDISNSGYSVGGLIGFLSGATLTHSYSDNRVGAFDNLVGGLVGSMEQDAQITNSYALGNITGQAPVGALVGNQLQTGEGTITNSYYRAGQQITTFPGGSTGIINTQGEEVSSTDLASAVWYRETLGWGDANTAEWHIENPVAAGHSPLINKEGFTTTSTDNQVPGQTGKDRP